MVDHNILGVWSGASSDKGKSGRRARSRRQGREPRESGGGAQRRALTPASTRGTCRSDDAPATTTSCGRHESRIRRFLAVANTGSPPGLWTATSFAAESRRCPCGIGRLAAASPNFSQPPEIGHEASRWGSGRPAQARTVVWTRATTCARRQNRSGEHTPPERTRCPGVVANGLPPPGRSIVRPGRTLRANAARP